MLDHMSAGDLEPSAACQTETRNVAMSKQSVTHVVTADRCGQRRQTYKVRAHLRSIGRYDPYGPCLDARCLKALDNAHGHVSLSRVAELVASLALGRSWHGACVEE